MNMFARFDEITSMTLQDIMENKTLLTDAQTMCKQYISHKHSLQEYEKDLDKNYYHNVTTHGVIGLDGTSYFLANPKSAEKTTIYISALTG